MNTLATALLAAGVFAPAAALLYGLTQPAGSAAYMFVLVLGCFALGAGLHLLARATLGRMIE